MVLKKLEKLNDFMLALNRSQGIVIIETSEGDRYNLKSIFSQYLALEKMLSEQSDKLNLICLNKDDEKLFEKFVKA